MRARTLFSPLPRHPLLRMLVLAGGAILLASTVAMSLIIGAAVLMIAATGLLIRHWLGGRKRHRGNPKTIEGEFSVVPKRPRGSLPGAAD